VKYPPGPRGRDVLGFFGLRDTAGTLIFLERTARRYGPVSSFRILHKRLYLVDDAELIRDILVTRQHSFERDSGANLLRELIGDGLLTREEPLHRERRRMLQPAFHKEQIATYAQTMVHEASQLSKSWSDGSIIDIRKEMRRLTLGIVGATMFGVDFRDSADAVATVLERVGRKSRWLAPLFTLIEPFVVGYRKRFPHGPSLFFREERTELERVIAPMIEKRRDSGAKDMLSLLLNMRDESGTLTAEDTKNEIVTFVLAGHETTATALTWTWYLLASHPEVEHHLQVELSNVLGDREPLLEDIPRLPYTTMIFQEALRLYPPALAFARRTKMSLKLAGYTIPKGASIFLSPFVTQRNEKYFERPNEFEPERWQSNMAPKFAYFPFGGGAKMCIGEPFARLEGVLALATLARIWKLENIQDLPVGIGTGFVLSPDKPLLMRLARRPCSNSQIYVSCVTTAS
jgi:cytochrome P450